MPKQNNSQTSRRRTRRDFLKTSSAAAAGAMAGSLAIQRGAHAAGDDTLKVGLVGCGGRGTGAAGDALSADANCILTAMADPFEDRLQASLKRLKTRMKDRIAVDADHCFAGFDGYQKVIDSGVDLVLLATPPHFRPMHLKACIDAGKHVFCEKPVAVDGPGIRSVLATVEEARKKDLNLVSGLCWRYYPATQEIMKRVLDGAIGEVMTIEETYNTGTLWHRGREPDDTEMAFQMLNWYYFTWLSGDYNVEQHVHSLDKGSWAMGDKPPLKAWGLGGRQVRTDPKYGNIYDHHAVVYEYEGGARMYSFCRQQAGCSGGGVTDNFFGTKGHCNVLKNYQIQGENPWSADRSLTRGQNMYLLEHQALFNAIRSGNTINNGQYMATSTMLAILGRMVTYTGREITWDAAINSQQDLSPSSYAWDADPPTPLDENGHYKIAMPGVTKFS